MKRFYIEYQSNELGETLAYCEGVKELRRKLTEIIASRPETWSYCHRSKRSICAELPADTRWAYRWAGPGQGAVIGVYRIE